MNNKKIILIGAVDEGHAATGGETMKNQLFVERFNLFFDNVIVVDTYHWRKRPWCLVRMLWVLLFNRGANVVISSSPDSAQHLLKFLGTFRLKKNVWYWVVGGSFHEKVKAGIYRTKYLRFLRAVIVQGVSMEQTLRECGVRQAVYVPNSKPMDYFPVLSERNDGIIRFVFLSRISPSKGCDLIFDCVRALEEKGYAGRFVVDFYGEPEAGYAREFEQKVSGADSVFYRGYLNMRNQTSYDLLAQYDVMLFPTFWQGEGFPGVVIDAMIAGLPLIATDWNLNREVIGDGVTGRIIPARNASALCEAMEAVICGKMDVKIMSENCRKAVRKYNYRDVLCEELFRNLGML